MRQHPDEVPIMHVPQTILALVAALPKPGTPMDKLRKRAFLQALSAVLDVYYPDREVKK